MSSNTNEVELFYYPTSYYSQKVRLALEEREIVYKDVLISLKDNEQSSPWFLKINPDGKVPALRIFNTCYSESEVIIDEVDKLPSASQVMLVPNADTQLGEAVQRWRKKLDDVPVANLSFGVILNPQLSPSGLNVPRFLSTSKEDAKKRFEKNLVEMKTLQERNPDMKHLYNKKITETQERLNDFFDVFRIQLILDNTDRLMKEIEAHLYKVSKESSDAQWLCGNRFTAADITLCVLLGRFHLLGLTARFLDESKYPTLVRYWKNAQRRPTVKKVVLDNVTEARNIEIRKKFKKYFPVVAGLCVAVLAVGFGYKLMKR